MRIILASQSLYRKKALDLLGLECETIPSDFDEQSIRCEEPKKLAKLLAEAKARCVGERERDSLVVAADLFSVVDGVIYEKPKTTDDARGMIMSFSGKRMDIVSGVAVYNAQTRKMLSTSQKYSVRFRVLTEYEVDDYIQRYPVVRFAAGLDHDGLLRFCDRCNGSYPFVYGLPMLPLISFLRANGIQV